MGRWQVLGYLFLALCMGGVIYALVLGIQALIVLNEDTKNVPIDDSQNSNAVVPDVVVPDVTEQPKPEVAVPEASAPVDPLEFKYHGCYTDIVSRVLPIHDPANMHKNAKECAAFAKERKARFFGLQFAQSRNDGRAECWAGNLPNNDINSYTGQKISENNCATFNDSTVGINGYIQSVYEVMN